MINPHEIWLDQFEGRLELGTFRSEKEYLSHHAKTIDIAQLEGEKDFNDDHREEFTDCVQSIQGFQDCDEEDVETWMACDAEDGGF
ncbi:hypothetical protein TNCV_1308371 [Trichonephila clavipes]|nr:hypothetical protein TNCV_1308371 [Trichonephila clavipes]